MSHAKIGRGDIVLLTMHIGHVINYMLQRCLNTPTTAIA